MPHRPPQIAALTLGAVFALATPSFAEDAVRLLVEVAEADREVEAGELISVQVVGEADSGARVGFGGRTVELRATEGSIEVVKRPYRFLYAAPASLDTPTEVVLRARLTEAPNVRGRCTLKVVPRKPGSGPYRALTMKADAKEVPLGGAIEVEVLGVPEGGRARPVTDRRITLRALGHTEPAGAVAFVRQGVFRYQAPPAGGAYAPGDRVRLVAVLDRTRGVRGELEITLRAAGRGEAPAPDGTDPGETPPEKEPPKQDPRAPEKEPDRRDPPAGEEPEGGLLFPSGNVRVVAWRTRETTEKAFGDRRTLPTQGTRFVAPAAVQRLRFLVEHPRVATVALELRLGEEDAPPRKIAAKADGPLRVGRNKAGRITVQLDLETPADGKPMRLALVLVTEGGKELREPFRLQRGRDGDRDGRPDR